MGVETWCIAIIVRIYRAYLYSSLWAWEAWAE